MAFTFGSFSIMAGRGKDCCFVCTSKIAKSSKSLKCSFCLEWYHVSCAQLEEQDYLFMSKRFKFGFRWFCDNCSRDVDYLLAEKAVADRLEKVVEGVTSVVSDSMAAMSERLNDLKGKLGSDSGSAQDLSQNKTNFAGILREALEEAKCEKGSTIINDRGNSKAIKDQNVLVVKPTNTSGDTNTSVAQSIDGVKESLEDIPVKSCKPTKTGGLVIKFPSKEIMNSAANVMNACLGDAPVLCVSEPKKMLPKMTVVDIPKSMLDEEIMSSILRKNAGIKRLVDTGLSLSLLFAREKEHSKTVILKMAPEIRKEIVNAGGFLYVGLSHCRAFDRVWVRQCYHCQGFSHNADGCKKKNEAPKCSFCAGSHRSRDCTNKNSPKCVNCASLNGGGSFDHFASSLDCPVMDQQRKKVMDNTNYTVSKNGDVSL